MKLLGLKQIFLTLLFTCSLLASTDLDVFPSIESIASATRFLMESTNTEEIEIEAEKLARAVGKTIPNSGEEKVIKDAIITIEQIRPDERTLTLEYYFPALEEITTEVEKIHVLRIWMIAFGTQRALYNAEQGDLDDVKQHLLLLTSNLATNFKESLNKKKITSQQVLGEDFVREVTAIIPSIVNIRREQQLLRAQARTDSVVYMDDGTPKTKLVYKVIPNGQCGFYGLDKTRESSSDEMVRNVNKPQVKQWLTAAALSYLTPGSNGGANRGLYVDYLQTRYGAEFLEHYNSWSDLVSINDEQNRNRDFTIRQLEQEKNELLKEKESHQERLDEIATEITRKSDLFIKSRTTLLEKIETAKIKFKEFLERGDVLKFIVHNLYKPQEWMQFNGSNQWDEVLDFGDVIAFINNLKVNTIAEKHLGIVSVSNSAKENAKEIFLLYSLLSNGMLHYDRLIDPNDWRGQIRAECHEKEFGLR